MASGNGLQVNPSGSYRSSDNPKLLQVFQQHVGIMTNTLCMIFRYVPTDIFSSFSWMQKANRLQTQRNGLSKQDINSKATHLAFNIPSKFNSCWDSPLRIAQSSFCLSSSHWWPEFISMSAGERLLNEPGYLNKVLACPQSFRYGFVNPEEGKISFYFSG